MLHNHTKSSMSPEEKNSSSDQKAAEHVLYIWWNAQPCRRYFWDKTSLKNPKILRTVEKDNWNNYKFPLHAWGLIIQLILTLQQSLRKQVVVHCVCNNLGHIIRLKLHKCIAFAGSSLWVTREKPGTTLWYLKSSIKIILFFWSHSPFSANHMSFQKAHWNCEKHPI